MLHKVAARVMGADAKQIIEAKGHNDIEARASIRTIICKHIVISINQSLLKYTAP